MRQPVQDPEEQSFLDYICKEASRRAEGDVLDDEEMRRQARELARKAADQTPSWNQKKAK